MEAQGEILAFLDDDVILVPSWLKALHVVFRDRDVGLLGGPSLPLYEVEPLSCWQDCPPAAPRKTWKDFLRPIKWKFERERILGKPSEGVRRLAAMARIAGVHFHENQVRNDPSVFEWVMRSDYFDYRLPDGWNSIAGPGQGRSDGG